MISILSVIVGTAILLSGCAVTAKAKTEKTTKVSDTADQFIKATDPTKSPAAATARTDTLVATIHKPGGIFLPYFYENGWDGNAVDPIFSSLVTTDNSGKALPDLAEKWTISPDNLTYTFYLRKNLKFSDGSPLTADDVAFTLTLLDDPAYDGYVDLSQSYIKGADEYKKGSAASISGIKVVSPTEIQITTTQINPLNLTILGGQVLSKAYYGKDYQRGKLNYLKALYNKPLGSGPYTLDQYVNGQEVRYNANPNYYGGEPSIKHLIFKITSTTTALQYFQTGGTDVDSFTPDQDTVEQLKSLGFADIHFHTVSDYGEVYINNKKSYLSDKTVRQALIYGLDRQKIVDVKYNGYGEVANVFTSPLVWSYTTDGVSPYKYDPDKAKQLLDQAGWKVGAGGIREKDGQKLRISFYTSSSTDAIIPVATEDYKALGIDFEPEVMDANTMFDKLSKGDYDLVSCRSNGLIDPNDSVQEFQSANSQNVAGYSDPQADKLIQEGIGTLDQSKRKTIYKQLYQVLSNDPPIILIDYRKSLSAWNARVEGLENNDFLGVANINLSKLKINASTTKK